MTNGAFYHHFDDKDALFGALAEPVVAAVSEIYSESVKRHFEKARTDELKQK